MYLSHNLFVHSIGHKVFYHAFVPPVGLLNEVLSGNGEFYEDDLRLRSIHHVSMFSISHVGT